MTGRDRCVRAAPSQPVLREALDVLDRHMFVSRAKAGAPDRCSDCHPDQPWPCDAVRMARLILVLQQPGGTTMTETPVLREALESNQMGPGVWLSILDDRVQQVSPGFRAEEQAWVDRVRAALAHPTSSPEPTGGYWDGGGKHHPAAAQPVLREAPCSGDGLGDPSTCQTHMAAWHRDSPTCEAVPRKRRMFTVEDNPFRPSQPVLREALDAAEALELAATNTYPNEHIGSEALRGYAARLRAALAHPTSSPEDKE